jgi:HEPN domain-containing protein
MSPAEDARLLLAIVRRHLRGLRVGLDPAFPEEDWGFSAQQAAEKLLKAWIVLADCQPPKVHDLADLAVLAGQPLDPLLRQLQVFAVEARYEEGPFPLPAERGQLLALLEVELRRCEDAVAGAD